MTDIPASLKAARAIGGDTFFVERIQVLCSILSVEYTERLAYLTAMEVADHIQVDDALTVTTSSVTDTELETAVKKAGAATLVPVTFSEGEALFNTINEALPVLGLEMTLLQATQVLGGVEPGDPYVPPTGYQNAYPKDAEVTHGGVLWLANREGATGVPGESPDWRPKPVEGVEVDWYQPHAGEEWAELVVVRYEGRRWRNDLGRPNGFTPGQPHSGWTDLGPTE